MQLRHGASQFGYANNRIQESYLSALEMRPELARAPSLLEERPCVSLFLVKSR